jgi:hypothetical protein
MKARTHRAAALRGQQGEWTCEDAEAARPQANQTARPWGARGPTPDQDWASRQRVGAAERFAFLEAVRQWEREARRAQGCAADATLNGTAQAAVNRGPSARRSCTLPAFGPRTSPASFTTLGRRWTRTLPSPSTWSRRKRYMLAASRALMPTF